MKRISLVLLFGALIAALAWWWSGQPETVDLSQDPTPTREDLKSVELKHVSGPFRLDQGRGKIVYLGYTHCPDICPLTLRFLAMHLKKLEAPLRERFDVVFVSLDYGRDEVANIDLYAKNFDPTFIGVGGDDTQISHLTDSLKTTYQIERSPANMQTYTISHADKLFFVDHQGQLVGSLEEARDANLVLAKIREVFK